MSVDAAIATMLTALITASGTWLVARRSGRATETAAATTAAASILSRYEELLDSTKAEMEDRLAREKAERVEFQDRLTRQQTEVVDAFAEYVQWVRDGAKPPPPWIAGWLYDEIQSRRKP